MFFFISVVTLTLLPLVLLGGGDTLAGHLDHQPIIRELSHLARYHPFNAFLKKYDKIDWGFLAWFSRYTVKKG
jgi:hypothetical protein